MTSAPAASKLYQLQVTQRPCLAAALGFDNFFPDRGKWERVQVALHMVRNNLLTLPVGASNTQCLSISNGCSQDRIPSCLRGEAVSAGCFLRASKDIIEAFLCGHADGDTLRVTPLATPSFPSLCDVVLWR